uniref:Uncharacterized protein n=1 Tax=Panagrolaimus davidi TaxID=227884 RepID=A0A914PU19_9BILA
MSTCVKDKQKYLNLVGFGQHHDDETHFKSINLGQQIGVRELIKFNNNGNSKHGQKVSGFCQTDMEMKDKSWNRKFSKDSKMPNFSVVKNVGDKLLKAENEWKSSKTKNNNGSTLSLHISAFENSVEAENGQNCENDAKKLKPKTIAETFKVDLKNSFEIPRQQENEEAKTPEVAEYHAFQQLDDIFTPVNNKKQKLENDFKSQKRA